jgi:hypothetical protein
MPISRREVPYQILHKRLKISYNETNPKLNLGANISPPSDDFIDVS